MVGLRSVIKIVESETIETRVFLINKMLLQLDRSLPLRNLKKWLKSLQLREIVLLRTIVWPIYTKNISKL